MQGAPTFARVLSYASYAGKPTTFPRLICLSLTRARAIGIAEAAGVQAGDRSAQELLKENEAKADRR